MKYIDFWNIKFNVNLLVNSLKRLYTKIETKKF